ncbi:hypothetical protein ACWN8V_13445 [Vagococcus elongatus]
MYNDTHQINGTPKITEKLQNEGQFFSKRTVGTYMKELGNMPVG